MEKLSESAGLIGRRTIPSVAEEDYCKKILGINEINLSFL
jgi:hypothetical protein